MMALAAPADRMAQCGSPGREFSGTEALAVGRTELAARRAEEPEPDALHPAARAAAPIAPSPRKARLVVWPGSLVSRVMPARMPGRAAPRKQTRKVRPR
jgi:hypothetical protein